MVEDLSKMLEAALPQDIAGALKICEEFEMEVFQSLSFSLFVNKFMMTKCSQHGGLELVGKMLPFYRVQLMAYLFDDM